MKPTSLSNSVSLIAACALLIPHSLANVEKTIFIAPAAEQAPQNSARRAEWHLADLPKLTHADHTLKADIEAGFPNASFPSGPETWMLLDELKPAKRYEARVCYAATQPTAFDVEAFSLAEILADKEGLFPFFAASFNLGSDSGDSLQMYGIRDGPSSRMLLRIQAKADYFTHDKNLMRNVPPVPVHVILDPFHFNVLPHSLLLTVFSLLAAAIVILSLVVYVLDCSRFGAWRSKGGVIMNAIPLGEPDRDGDTSSMNRDSDREEGVGLFGYSVAKEDTRSVSRGRRSTRNPWGSAFAADPTSVHRAREAQKALGRSSSASSGASGDSGSHAPGRGASARGRGKSKGRGKGGKKGRKKRR